MKPLALHKARRGGSSFAAAAAAAALSVSCELLHPATWREVIVVVAEVSVLPRVKCCASAAIEQLQMLHAEPSFHSLVRCTGMIPLMRRTFATSSS